MKETLRIKQIKETYKKKDGKVTHGRYVEISDEEGKLKVVFNNSYGDLPTKVRNLDEETDLEAEVEIEINFNLKSRQQRLA